MPTHRLTIDHQLHTYLREIARRRRKQVGAVYVEVMQRYLHRNRVPKQVDKITRKPFTFQTPEDFALLFNEVRIHAAKRQQFPVVVLEEAIREWIGEPEQYLGKNFDKSHGKQAVAKDKELQKVIEANHQRRKA